MERLIRRTAAQAVADSVEASIIAGEYEAGSFLPPERKLAAILGVSRLTVREGLSRLIARGTLIAVPGMGTCVTSVRFAPGLESMPAAFQLERAKLRKFEIMQQFLEFRRYMMAEILVLACTRCPEDTMGWIESALRQVVFAVEQRRSIGHIMSLELDALRCAAQMAEAWPFWLTLNTIERFFAVAREELSESVRPEDLRDRAGQLMSLLAERDADGIRKYVRETLGAADLQQIRRFYRRLHGESGKGTAGPNDAARRCTECPARRRDPVRQFGHPEQPSPEDDEGPPDAQSLENEGALSAEPEAQVEAGEAPVPILAESSAEEVVTEQDGAPEQTLLGPTPFEPEYYDPEELRMFKRSFGKMPWELEGFDPNLPLPATGPPKRE